MRIIGNDPSTPRQAQIVASGTLSTGATVVVNSDGTVSVITETGASQVVGSSTTVGANNANYYDSAYDTNAQKVVLVYVDLNNQQRAYAVVGTVSGTSITFGTPVEYGPSTSMQYTRVVYDENAQKVVAAYHDGPNGTSTRGAARVGTISGTSISFGTATTFFSLGTAHISMAYDANAQKIVIAFQDTGNTNYAKAVVGTVSGTSISFGSSAFFTSTNTSPIAITYDANAQKCVIAYGAALTARVATVSGTSISFGTAVSLGNNIVSSALAITYDSNAQKVVVAYADQNDNQYGKVRVGTVSGTDISFGSFVTFQAATMQPISAGSPILEIAYDSTASKIALTYDDSTNSSYGTVVTGTVSGTTVVLDTPTVFNSTHSDTFTTSYDANAGKLVLFCRNDTTSDRAEAVVFQTGYTSTNLTAENYIGTAATGAPDGTGAKINLKGAVDENQSGLTAGQSYYVQTDGTLGTTPADPSVFAGTAVAATKLIVKG